MLFVDAATPLAHGIQQGWQFRADAFNVFNTPNFANPIGVMTSGNFGGSTQTLNAALGGINSQFQIGGPRSVQLALKLLF